MALRLNLRGRVDDAVSARRYCALSSSPVDPKPPPILKPPTSSPSTRRRYRPPWARWGRHAEVAQYCSSAAFTQSTFWVDVK
ncbi:hypothetical protein BM221_008963 [Beauveria bassiana]|uniref:Uncharacterized protein n=1 Tax=Beauveria bassiana TaxID=176275 RepID=A0A2N6NEC7_BEABA|nr:hypothetical protein BM221_008963 [Beauveria bassiana]